MKFHPRSDWGARSPEHRSSIGDVLGCTVHWHGPGLGAYDHGDCPGLVRSMQDFHMDSNGWSDLGYSLVCCRHGHVYEGRGIGVRGAHAGTSDIGGNDRWYGVQAMIGQGDTITAELLAGLVDAIAYCRRGGAGGRINGHRDHHATDCPGDQLYAWAHGSPMEDDDMPSAQEVADALLDTPIEMLDGRMWKVRYVLANLEKDTDLIPKRVLNADMVPKYDVAYSEQNMENNPTITLKYGVAQAVANGAKAEDAVGALEERMTAYEEKLDMILQKLEEA